MKELQQQVTTLKVKEATLSKTHAEGNQLFQELNTRLAVMEAEHRKTKEEVRDSSSSGFGNRKERTFPSCAKAFSLQS